MIRSRALLHNSVIGKELRTRMRGWRSSAVLTLYMAVLGVIAIAFLIQQAGPTSNQSSQVGVQLFEVLALFQLFLILFVTPASTAGAISGERQRQTWDLLLVTRLSALGIVWGKLTAGLAFDLLLILASLPLFSLVFLFGGVAPDDVLNTYIVFLCTVLLLGVASLLISALTRRLAVSMIASNILALFLGVGLSLLTLYLENFGSQSFGPRGPLPPAPLTPLAEIDPFAALLSAVPGNTGTSTLGGLDIVHHAFGLPLNLHLWAAYSILAVVISVVLLGLTTLLVRFSPGWLTRGAA
jgi:ABC-2 type transport system permease protein